MLPHCAQSLYPPDPVFVVLVGIGSFSRIDKPTGTRKGSNRSLYLAVVTNRQTLNNRLQIMVGGWIQTNPRGCSKRLVYWLFHKEVVQTYAEKLHEEQVPNWV